jgi:serine/threonine-protein kinase RsbW
LRADDPAQISTIRRAVDTWLQGLDWPEGPRSLTVMAVSEACSNVIEHAYVQVPCGDVEIEAAVRSNDIARYVAVTVRDWGLWLRASPVAGADRHGLGLPVANRCMSSVEVHRSTTGSIVRMLSVAVPAAGQ